jgi:adenylate cyclase class IV
MSTEIELRARFDEAKHDALIEHLTAHGEDLGANNKHIYFFVLPDKLLKVVDNLSTGTAKISLKGSRIGQGSAFAETEMTIPSDEVATAVEIFNQLGYANLMHEAYNQRHDFRFRDVEIAVKHSEAWGHHAEFEVLLDDEASEADIDDAVDRIHQVADELGATVMTEDELAEFTAKFEQSQA